MASEKRIGLVLNCGGLGDHLYCIPVIKRLKELCGPGTGFDVFSAHPGIFQGCPYVDNSYAKADTPALENYPHEKKIIFDISSLPFALMETMDFISIPLGIGELSFRQKQLEYFPVEDDRADRYDVVLNSSMTWPTRSWPMENWQRLADTLVDRGYTVAVVGKDVYAEGEKAWKRSAGLRGCTDLTNKLSLDQTYFTIAKCSLFISCQNGLSVLSGTTNTEIIVLDQSIEWSKRAIYRNEDPHYKVSYVKGDCTRYCCVSFECPLENAADKLKCVPDFDRVLEKTLEKIAAVNRA